MNVDYIKNLSEAYVIDNQLYKENLKPIELFENFYNMIKDIRENEPYLYKELTESNKFEQQHIFKTYFDIIFKPEEIFVEYSIEDLEQLNESIILGTSIGAILIYLIRKPLSKIVMTTSKTIMDLLNNIGETLSKSGNQTRLAYAIIQNNSKKCYEKCEFDPEDAAPSDYMVQYKKGSTPRNIGRLFQFDEEDEEKSDCLRECYFYSVKEVVKLTANNYFTCLKSTGDLSKLPLERDFTAYQQVLSNSGLSVSCETLGKNLIDSLKLFNRILELIHDDNPMEIRKQRNDLMTDIYNLQKQSTGSSPGQYQVKSFPQRPALPNNKPQQNRPFQKQF